MKFRTPLLLLPFCFLIPALPPEAAGQTAPPSAETVTVFSNRAVLALDPGDSVSLQVLYGERFSAPDRSFASSVSAGTFAADLDELTPGTLYYYRADFFDANNVRQSFRTGWFVTSGVSPLRITMVRPIPSIRSVEIEVLSSREAAGRVVLSNAGRRFVVPLKSAGRREIAMDLDARRTFSAAKTVFTKLNPLTAYAYRVELRDADGTAVSAAGTFTTLESDLALAKPVTGTFTNHDFADTTVVTGDVLARAVDGSMNFYSGMAVSADPASAEQWIVVDLQKPVPVGSVTAYWRSLAYPDSYLLSFSRDGKMWTSGIRVGPPASDRLIEGMPMKIFTTGQETDPAMKGLKARYVRLSVPRGTEIHRRFENYRFVQLVELKVYPAP